METEAEDDGRRKPPPRPYLPVDLRLVVPKDAVHATLQFLSRAGRRESCVLWYGTRDTQGDDAVQYVVAPPQTMAKFNYHISADAMAAVVKRLELTWKPLAQVHSHPGTGVEHSTYDDEMISSRRALSLVFPEYGRSLEAFPAGVGVHEWQTDYWHLLHPHDAARRVSLVRGSVKMEDLR